ncbi:efflux RND transporter permease subunit, partial [Enterobacter asburiae]
EGASRRFRAVMMTAVSFIIGVLPMMLATRAGAHIPPNNRTTVLTRNLVATVVGIHFIPALFVHLNPQRHLGPVSYKKKTPHHKYRHISYYLLFLKKMGGG